MKNRYLNIMILIMSIVLIVWTAFYIGNRNRETKQEVIEPVKISQIPEDICEEINGVRFNTSIDKNGYSVGNNLRKSIAKEQVINAEQAIDVLLAGKEIKEERIYPGKGYDGVEFEAHYAKTTDNCMVNVSRISMTYSTDFFNDVYRAFQLEYNKDLYSTEKVFEFKTPEQAAEEVIEVLKKIGLSIEDYQYICFALDHETMQDQENDMYKDEDGNEIPSLDGRALVYKDAWTEEDDCYYLCFTQKQQSIPVYYGSNFFKMDAEENMPIQAVVSKRGIERLDIGLITGLYQFIQEEDEIKFIDFNIVLQKVANVYGNILTDSKYEVTRIALYQMPIRQKNGNYVVKPIWLFRVNENGTDGNGKEFVKTRITVIDAATGEEVWF